MKGMSLALGAGLFAASVIVPASAQVAPAQVVSDVTVPYDDLDLKSEAGARAMLARLDAAATRACGGKPAPVMPGDPVALAKQREYRRCKAAAMDGSTLRLGSPRVRTAWIERQGSAEKARPLPGMAQADLAGERETRAEAR